jgi:hypothetical protein
MRIGSLNVCLKQSSKGNKNKKGQSPVRLAQTKTDWVSRYCLRFATSILLAVLVAASKWTFT